MSGMNRTRLLSLAAFLALLGLVDAWYLADMAFAGASLTCNVAGLEGCNVVAQSAYSKVFGLPLALYGALFYAMFILALGYVHFKPGRLSTIALGICATSGVLFSGYFLYVQFFLIKALCIYCLGSAAITACIFILVIWGLTTGRLAPPIRQT
jgi:uncharacterized membrane protein